jgi:hypothetical protein
MSVDPIVEPIAETRPNASRLQFFEAETLALRASWSGCAVAPHTWERIGNNGGTDSAPFDVKDQNGLRGKAKPGFIKPDVSRAAHEKIASDLAALLDLPIPPVTLCKLTSANGLQQDPNQPGDPFVCVSAWAFPTCDEWRIHAAVITEEEKASTIIPLSAVWVFDSWISAQDRDHSKHILVSPSGQPPLEIACIDYAFSLSQAWASGAVPGAAGWQMPFEVAKRDVATVSATANRVASMKDTEIEEIVNRIENGWLPDDRRKLILKNLLERRGKIHEIVGTPRP